MDSIFENMSEMDKLNTKKETIMVDKSDLKTDTLDGDWSYTLTLPDGLIINDIGTIDEATKLKRRIDDLSSRTYDDMLGCISRKVNNRANYGVYIKDNKVNVGLMDDTSLYTARFHTEKYGDFVSINRGEFGGTVYKIENNTVLYPIIHDTCVGIIEVNGNVYAICELSHMGYCEFTISKLECFFDRYEIEHIVSGKMHFNAFTVYKNNIYFSANTNIYKIDTTKDNEVSHVKHIGYYDMNNFVIHKNKIYLGCNGQAVEIDMKKFDTKYYTFIKKEDIQNDWYACDMKLLDFWDKITIE